MKVDVELEPFTPLLRPTYADAHAGAISEVRMEGYEFGHTYVWQGPEHASITEGNNLGSAVRVARLHASGIGCARATVTLTYGRCARFKALFLAIEHASVL